MEQSPSSGANNHSTSPQIPLHLPNPKVNYHVHNSPGHWSLSWTSWIQSTPSNPVF